MRNKIDCRMKKNKNNWVCRKKRFCNQKENNFISAGKGLISLASPTTGVVLTAYDTGKSIIKLGICKR
jgi:hypothetical protein